MKPLLVLVALIWAGTFVAVAWRRHAQARAAARAASTEVEASCFCRAAGSWRTLVLAGAAILLCVIGGRHGQAVALVFSLIAAPAAAGGSLRVLAITARGIVLDGAFAPWSEWDGFAAEGGARRLTLWRRPPLPPVALDLPIGRRNAIASALRARLAEIRPA